MILLPFQFRLHGVLSSYHGGKMMLNYVFLTAYRLYRSITGILLSQSYSSKRKLLQSIQQTLVIWKVYLPIEAANYHNFLFQTAHSLYLAAGSIISQLFDCLWYNEFSCVQGVLWNVYRFSRNLQREFSVNQWLMELKTLVDS